jgi:hypothetical protein
MKTSIPAALLAAALSIASHVTQASEAPLPGAHVPDTEAARKSADLIARAEKVLSAYLAACSAGETPALRQITTIDLRVDQALEEPGAFVTYHGSTTAACDAFGASGASLEDYWILPTNDETAVFVHAEGRLALLELRDERIARVVNYGARPSGPACSAISASTERNVSSLTGLTK